MFTEWMWSKEGSPRSLLPFSFLILKNIKATGEFQEYYTKYSYTRRKSSFGTGRRATWRCCLQIFPISVDGNTTPPATQPREQPFSLTCIHQSVILLLQLSTFFPRTQVLPTNSSAMVLVQIAITSHLDYCSSRLAGCPASTVAFLQLLPNIAASLNLLKHHLLSSSCRNTPVASSLS